MAEMVRPILPTGIVPSTVDDAGFHAAVRLWQQYGDMIPLPVVGHSMLPLLRPGDRLTIVARTHYHCGDIVLFGRDDALIVHRIVGKVASTTGRTWLTQGDNCISADAPVSTAAILGQVVAIQRNHRTYQLNRLRWRVAGRLLALATRGPWPQSTRHQLLRVLAKTQFQSFTTS